LVWNDQSFIFDFFFNAIVINILSVFVSFEFIFEFRAGFLNLNLSCSCICWHNPIVNVLKCISEGQVRPISDFQMLAVRCTRIHFLVCLKRFFFARKHWRLLNKNRCINHLSCLIYFFLSFILKICLTSEILSVKYFDLLFVFFTFLQNSKYVLSSGDVAFDCDIYVVS